MKSFFNRDDVSRATSGKRETVTTTKIKRQKRYLLDNRKNLHKKFKNENPDLKLKYPVFTRLRPFYVLNLQAKDRDTCLCTIHANLTLKLQKLVYLKVVKACSLDDLIEKVTCDTTSMKCMYNKCKKCINLKIPTINSSEAKTEWWVWVHNKIERKDEDLNTNFRRKIQYKIVKTRKEGTIEDLMSEFNAEFVNFKAHSFNIKQQYKAFRMCKGNLLTDQATIHIDFSQNYCCKLSAEIQPFHFGSSRSQVTLHTGLIYLADKTKPTSFCSISPANDHGPPAIWAHLQPVIDMIKERSAQINVMHIFSDGPSSQYRQKRIFLSCLTNSSLIMRFQEVHGFF